MATDERAKVLDALDFDMKCENSQCKRAAELYVGCRFCGAHALLCNRHWEQSLARLTERIASATTHICCGKCKHVAPSLRELVEVIPL